MSSDSDSNPFSPSDQSSKNLDEASLIETKEEEEIKNDKIESKEISTDTTKTDKDKKEKDDEPAFSNSALEARISAIKTKIQLETEDREKMQ